MTMRRWFTLLLILGSAAPLHAQEVPTLEMGLGREAREILKGLKADGIRNVGVLKFLLVREGGNKFSDSLGTLNTLLARRLEVALVVKNDPRNPIGIIENASAVAEKIPGASHTSREGLEKLFAAEYPLAWGKDLVHPDAFLLGTGQVSSDLKTLTLSIMRVDAKNHKPRPVTKELVVRIRPEHLSEIGESFHRGAFDGGGLDPAPRDKEKRNELLLEEAKKVREKERPHPVEATDAPFTLEVLYDDKVQPVEVRDGQAWIAEPNEGQKVALRYTRRDRSDRTFGVVLKVNGENTLGREKLPDAQCRCWILGPQFTDKPITVLGFQISDTQRLNFRVASREESKQREVYYGNDVGMITMTVFPERKGKRPAPPRDFEHKDEQIIRRTELPTDKSKTSTFGQLQQELYAGLDRGLIVEGKADPSRVEVQPFEYDPTPVMTLTIRYYRK
jgi:hypothetical protein